MRVGQGLNVFAQNRRWKCAVKAFLVSHVPFEVADEDFDVIAQSLGFGLPFGETEWMILDAASFVAQPDDVFLAGQKSLVHRNTVSVFNGFVD